MFEGDFKFLDGQKNKSNKIAFASFPRSGNTFLRKYSELLTGVQTGADNTLHISVMLQMQKMKGEDIVDDTCWIIKTHSPWCMLYAPKFKCQKIMCVVRNPLDIIISWFNLCNTVSHNMKVSFEVNKEYPNWWNKYVEKVVNDMKLWYRRVIHDAEKSEVPTIFVRYEDLCMNPKPELELLMKFFTGMTSLEGTNAQRRIEEVLAMGEEATQTYSLKDSSKKFCSAIKYYTPVQVDHIKKELEDVLYFFGYAKTHLDPGNLTGFFEFDKATDIKNEQNHNGFKKHSTLSAEWIGSMSDEELAEFQYQLSDPTKDVALADLGAQAQFQTQAMRAWTEK